MKTDWLDLMVWAVVAYVFYQAFGKAAIVPGNVTATSSGTVAALGPFPLAITPAGNNLNLAGPRTQIEQFKGYTYLGPGASSFGTTGDLGI